MRIGMFPCALFCLGAGLTTACDAAKSAPLATAPNAPIAKVAGPAVDNNWPQWRGPNLNGSIDTANPPLTWSETENIVWKTKLPWWSGSTPIVWGDHIFVTSPEAATPENEKEVPRDDGPHAPGGPMLLLLCLNRADGAILWTRELGRDNRLKRKQNMSSPSPVTDGESVWVMTGMGKLFRFDFAGAEKWKRDINAEYKIMGQMWGYASSPTLAGDKLVLAVLHGYETDDPSFLLALNKATGETLWKAERPNDALQESPDSYATPQVCSFGGQAQIVMNGGDAITGTDPTTGKELWRVAGTNPDKSPWYRTIGSVVCGPNIILSPSRRDPLSALRPDAKGIVAESNVLWRFRKGPDVPTPVTDGKYVWFTDDDGRFSCLDANTGAELYKPQRIAQGTYSASLVKAGHKIYAINESGVTSVVTAGPEFKILATNALEDEYTLSSPVVLGDQMLIRTSTSLYLIGKK